MKMNIISFLDAGGAFAAHLPFGHTNTNFNTQNTSGMKAAKQEESLCTYDNMIVNTQSINVECSFGHSGATLIEPD